ncbi:3-hydroxybutyryl-CoA dehydrogenase [Rhizobium sp. RU36D]|uniref:3-hydroxybutyryl-CoA dehydrogenase n=1 Tax=Rhizobium sp. RU36D TaxID=1907415 RepID=UPI0009D856AA|nr:3-hydroxybutyryl-CoA dehydrogenase [Rhizobium sp. RU36D]SMC51753.1 3-hydroxyacyl-CoA dehydrogenase [Rhizobium sp. RU36D]
MSGGETGKTPLERIAVLGAGRMGRGIATVFAYAGHEVDVIDFKERPQADFDTLAGKATQEVRETLLLLGELGLFAGAEIADRLASRVRVLSRADAAEALAKADVIFEGFPEVLDVKRQALAEASELASKDAIIASTTSTILVDDLSPAVVGPERFLNAHWLNPAFIVPLVELSPGKATSAATIERLKGLLESIGKIPIVCSARPGFIVPRIQAIAMNEAARLVEEGVASVEDIEKAVKYGFGFRFSVLGVLEFIDWGGGDILYHASNYLAEALEDERYRAPDIITENMKTGRIGITTGQGFLDYAGMDVPAYRRARLAVFVERLKDLDLGRPPVV